MDVVQRRDLHQWVTHDILPGMLDRLFSPLELGPVTIPNRVVSTSHQTTLVHDHLPTDDLIAYHRARAAGGAGLIVIEATAIHSTGLLTPHTVGGYLPEIVPAYRRLADAVHEHGTRLFCQLFHGGREIITSGPRPPAVSASSIPSARFMTEPRELSVAEIEEMLEGYRQAAAFARAGGLDGVEVCAGFGYLPTQFLSAHANARTDRYGGSFTNRLRFLREVLGAMREGIGPDGAVGCRLTDESGSYDGTDEADVIEAAGTVADEGLADYISVALGGSSTYRGSTWIVPPSPTRRNAIEAFARRFKPRVTVPLIAAGRVLDPAEADRMIGEGVCEAVGMTRAMIADPGLARKARAGEPVTACIGCNQGCIGHYHAGIPIACTVNPWTGFEARLPLPVPAARPETVVVVGAGPAGCAAAAAAAACGHRAIVLERAADPGGQMRFALGAPGHAEIAGGLLDVLAGWLAAADVRFGVDAGADDVLALSPDRVVVATGAEPHRPALAGAGVDVVHAWDALAGAEVGGRVLVSDWGGDWTGLDAAEALAARGARVRLMTSAVAFGTAVHQYQRNLYLARLDEAGVELIHHLRPVSLRPEAVECANVFSHRPVSIEGVDTLVVSAGRTARNDLHDALLAAGVPVERAGDTLSPRSFEEAIREGTLAGMGIAEPAAA
jgi:2,4-dienoyl-CoA reductase-like NADH-dependent reductase (Old Yellow Enzyme family)/thioredoxin reductase